MDSPDTPNDKGEKGVAGNFTDGELETLKAVFKQLAAIKVDFKLLAEDLNLNLGAARKRWERMVAKHGLKGDDGSAAGSAGGEKAASTPKKTPAKKTAAKKKLDPTTPKKRKIKERTADEGEDDNGDDVEMESDA